MLGLEDERKSDDEIKKPLGPVEELKDEMDEEKKPKRKRSILKNVSSRASACEL